MVWIVLDFLPEPSYATYATTLTVVTIVGPSHSYAGTGHSPPLRETPAQRGQVRHHHDVLMRTLFILISIYTNNIYNLFTLEFRHSNVSICIFIITL